MIKFNFKIPFKEYMGLLKTYLKPQGWIIAVFSSLLLIGILFQLINPQIIRYFLDSATQNSSTNQLIFAAILFIGFSFAQQGITLLASYLGENVGWVATNHLRKDVAKHVLNLDMTFHKSHTPGSIIERMDGDINALTNFFSSFFINLIGNFLLMLGVIILLFRESWMIGTAMSVFIVAAYYVIQRIRRFSAPFWDKLRDISSDFYGFLSEHLESTEETRANGATKYVMSKFFKILRKWLPVRVGAFLSFGLIWITTILIFTVGNATSIGISSFLWDNGFLSVGTIYMIFYYTELLVKPIEKLRTQMEDLQRADASINRIKELLNTKPKIVDGAGVVLPEGAFSIKYENVSFGYEENSTILHNVNITIQKGSVLGVVGRTGSGKTTFARLLLRFYDPINGSIRIDDMDLRDMKLKELRKRIGYVTQQVEIFQASVKDNLTLFDNSIPDKHIVNVLEDIGLGRWYQSLPYGLNTMLNASGSGLSAGEAQLISFARVFMNNAGVVILDEASSRLDTVTENLIEAAISKLLVNRTCIVIAHRLSTLKRADDILILEDGQVIEYDKQKNLVSDSNSRFYKMLKTGSGIEEMLA
ncbi:ATP-binding cassette, subfamily B [Fontibacillus panacisegetis]|uniref:ATP-binding cassette, subfamily B n=1 Tax=Fontibacillus panacisegetis TaxID=670482 RepID=A0A1G7HGA1_9BACL|nr:ABC transporter ATP-binding protein [Fontibacillus panacisegetis]SDE99435.1 ATP-binding cassette, subfamily B [Fontibacillus panacisegetis]